MQMVIICVVVETTCAASITGWRRGKIFRSSFNQLIEIYVDIVGDLKAATNVQVVRKIKPGSGRVPFKRFR